ncbi:hypothetical protein D3C72_2244560 [compost metagenome]
MNHNIMFFIPIINGKDNRDIYLIILEIEFPVRLDSNIYRQIYTKLAFPGLSWNECDIKMGLALTDPSICKLVEIVM